VHFDVKPLLFSKMLDDEPAARRVKEVEDGLLAFSWGHGPLNFPSIANLGSTLANLIF